ncbi:MAG: VOC family protein [Oscillospiraceae bacterium]
MFIQHVCISVKDLDRSVAFYRDVMGFMQVTPPQHVDMLLDRAPNAPDDNFSYYGYDCAVQCFRLNKNAKAKMAVMLADPANGGCIEIQCFTDPATTQIEQNYITTGIKEICFQCKNLTELKEWDAKLKAAGVDMRTEIWNIGDGALTHSTVLFHDPDGNILQIAAAEVG